MKPEALVFLETREARMLAAAWPEHFKKQSAKTSHYPASDWCDRAGVAFPSYRAMNDVMGTLRDNRICLDDGTLDPDAAAFIKQAAYAAAGLQIQLGEMRIGAPSTMGRPCDKTGFDQRVDSFMVAVQKNNEGMIEETRDQLRDWCNDQYEDLGEQVVQARKELAETQRKLRETEAERDQLAESVRIARANADEWRKDYENVVLRRAGGASATGQVFGTGCGAVRPAEPAKTFDSTGHAAGCDEHGCESWCKQPRKEKSGPTAGC